MCRRNKGGLAGSCSRDHGASYRPLQFFGFGVDLVVRCEAAVTRSISEVVFTSCGFEQLLLRSLIRVYGQWICNREGILVIGILSPLYQHRMSHSSHHAPVCPIVGEGRDATPTTKPESELEGVARSQGMPAESRPKIFNPADPKNRGVSDFVKSIVFGGHDGIVSTFAVVAASAGAGQDYKTVLIFGFANVLADGFSMGFGELVSGNAKRDYAISERKREEWEVQTDKDLEKIEMIEIYHQKGLSFEDACTVVDIISKDDKVFVDIMMLDELQLLIEDKWRPTKEGLVMFTSFVCFGMLPLLVYLGGKGEGTDWVFGVSCAIVAVALLILGSVKGVLTSMRIPKAALAMLFNGAVSGGVSYGAGVLVEYIVNSSSDAGSTGAS